MRKISTKLFLISLASIIITASVVLIPTLASMRRIIDEFVRVDMQAAMNAIEAVLDKKRESTLAAAVIAVQNHNIINALQAGDNQRLLYAVNVLFAETLVFSDPCFVTVTDCQGIVLARTHSTQTGDCIARRRGVSRALNRLHTSDIEPDGESALSIVSTMPIITGDGAVIGTISVGFDMGQPYFVDLLQHMTNTEVTVFAYDVSIMTTIVSAATGARSYGVTIAPHIGAVVLGERRIFYMETEIAPRPGELFLAYYKPFLDETGEVLGLIFSGQNITAVRNIERQAIRMSLVLSVLVIVFVFLTSRFISGKIIVQPVKRAIHTVTQLSCGNMQAAGFDSHSNDELGQLTLSTQKLASALLRQQELVERERELEIKLHQQEMDERSRLKLAAMNEQLEAALQQALFASRAKSEFLSNMSHEMRTPMNAIIGMTAIGKKAMAIEEKNHALDKIGEASSHLLGVINDILDMAKIEANKLELAPVEFNFESMLQKVMTVINFRADEKEQLLTVELKNNIPGRIIGDDQRLAQVITNLLSNAVKFTPEGGKISLAASLVEESAESCVLKIEVIDSGIGISGEQQRKLFQAFEQAQTGTSRDYGGTGLGLAISKKIIELMGGNIWVESELGKGAKFVFTVKVRRGKDIEDYECPEKSGGIISYGEFADKRALLAEDVEINREIFIALLEDTGLFIDCAENGQEALDMIITDPGTYDIVFMDLQMPKMDGYEATRCIRSVLARWGVDKRLPIIALTANVFKDDIKTCIEAGMDDHLGKPLDIAKVMEILRKYLRK